MRHPRPARKPVHPTRLIGATYLHAQALRPVVVIDHERAPPTNDGSRARTGRLVVRHADTRLEILFLAQPEELLDLPAATSADHDGATR